MKLTVRDRLIVHTLYPKEGNLVTQIVVRDLKEKLKFTQEEFKELEFKVTDQGYQWNIDKEKEVDYELTSEEIKLLKQGVEDLDKANKITQDNLDLCTKIKDTQ